jgi:MYXO-CTERM domain-containing protein
MVRTLVVLLLVPAVIEAAPRGHRHRHKISPVIRVWLSSPFIRSMGPGDGDDSGCGCRVGAEASGGAGLLLLIALLAPLLLLRRPGGSRRGRSAGS